MDLNPSTDVIPEMVSVSPNRSRPHSPPGGPGSDSIAAMQSGKSMWV